MKYGAWPSEFTEAQTTQPSNGQNRGPDETVKSLLQPTRQAAFMKNKKRNESSHWMMQQAAATPPNMQQMNYGSGPVQSYVDDNIDFSAYEMGKKNFQNFVSGDSNLPAGAYYDTPAYVDPTTGKVMNYEVPSNPSMQPQQQQIKILEVNMQPNNQNIREAQNSMPMRQPCTNPNCTGCRGQ